MKLYVVEEIRYDKPEVPTLVSYLLYRDIKKAKERLEYLKVYRMKGVNCELLSDTCLEQTDEVGSIIRKWLVKEIETY